MTYHEFEQVCIAFSLGVIARPVLRLIVDEHRRGVIERDAEARQARAAALRRPLPRARPRAVEPPRPYHRDGVAPPSHPSCEILPPLYVRGDQ